jgi:type IV pilus assembly protein PilA
MEWLKEQHGFTLVEIIVVLVVLAILAAFTIPTMLGFVADAKGKAYIAEAREVYVAAQAVATEYIAKTDIMDGNISTDGANKHWGSGLAVSVSSYEVLYRKNNFLIAGGSTEYNTPQVNASRQMYRYISNDRTSISNINLLTNAKATPSGKDAAWIVTIGEGDDNYAGTGSNGKTRTGKVTKVIYLRDGYRVTITDDNTTVEKW